MNRSQAAERIRKLRALADPARGGAPAERKLAASKADKLAARFGISATETRPPPTRPRAQPWTGQTPAWEQRTWTAPATGPAVWEFNVATGQATPNVKVHHYTDHANWKIEIPVVDVLAEDKRQRAAKRRR